MKNDLDILEFARKISMLTIDTPLSMQYDKNFGQKKNVWWACQREHLSIWCLFQPTNGVKGFTHKPNNSTRLMYNRFSRPETLLWLIEALIKTNNVDFNLEGLINEIEGLDYRKALKIIKEKAPFDTILSWTEKINILA